MASSSSCPRHDMKMALLQTASIGLHTMRLEHFGIAVVEFMAAGLVVVAHASGGPLLDIVSETGERGFVATDARDYATKLASVIEMDASSRRKIGEWGRAYVAERFSDSAFGRTFVSALAVLLYQSEWPPAAATVLKGGAELGFVFFRRCPCIDFASMAWNVACVSLRHGPHQTRNRFPTPFPRSIPRTSQNADCFRPTG